LLVPISMSPATVSRLFGVDVPMPTLPFAIKAPPTVPLPLTLKPLPA